MMRILRTPRKDPEIRYPVCFQGGGIMVWAGVVVQVVEGRVGWRFN